MKKTNEGYEFKCGIEKKDKLSVVHGGVHPTAIYFKCNDGALLPGDAIDGLISALARFRKTGSMFPEEQAEVETLKDQVATLTEQLAAAHKATAPKEGE